VAAVARAVSVTVVVVGEWASGVAALGPSSGVTSLRGFDVGRDPSLDCLQRDPRRSERLDVEVRLCPMAPLRLSPFNSHARHLPAPLPLAAIIEHAVCAECPDCTLVQLCLIRANDEESTFTRLSRVARPVARLKLSGLFRTRQQPYRDGHQDCRPNDHDASSKKPIVPCKVAEDEREKADGDQRGR
jgi:hypothetical protein